MSVSEPRPGDISKGAERRLHICAECASELVHPVEWEETAGSRWTVTVRCPNCEWTGCGTYEQSTVDCFDEELDLGAQALMRDLRELAQANMRDDVERLAGALAAGAILPEDF